MRSLDFGQGDAATEIPGDWVSSVDERGTTIANPPDQDVAFLWLSTLSWEMPATPDFSPADYFLQRPDAEPVLRTEERDDAVITYSVDERVEDGVTFESHQFQVLPKRAVDGLAIAAFLTLSVRRDEDARPFIQQALDDTWSIARRVTFSHERAA